MKNLKMKVIGMSFLILLFSSLGSFAQENRPDRENRGKRQGKREQAMKERGPRIPDLTDEQKEQLKTLRVKLQRETLPLKNELREKKARLQTLTTQNNSSDKEINNVIDEIGTLQTKMMKTRVAHKREMRKFLTEEQRLFLDSTRGMRKKNHRMKG